MKKIKAVFNDCFEVFYESFTLECPKCGKKRDIMTENREYKNPVTCSCGETFMIDYD